MNILKEDFCINVTRDKDKKLYISYASLIFDKYDGVPSLSEIYYDYYGSFNCKFVGYKEGNAFTSNLYWKPIISIKEYVSNVKTVLGIIEIPIEISIDEYSII